MAAGTCRIMMIPCQTRLESLSPGRLDLAHKDSLNSLFGHNSSENKNPPQKPTTRSDYKIEIHPQTGRMIGF